MPRTRLEEVVAELTEHANGVLHAQGRLRELLRANALVASEISLPMVLRRIVEAAQQLLGARYAALGVIGWDGQLEQFIHVGMDDETVARIGRLPRGAGILGLLINEPQPLRLSDLAGHPASSGFPAHHPPMTTFLGVPLRVGNEVFGNLYLADKQPGGDFTAEDEQLLIAMAAAAGAAVSNARMYAESEQRRRWLAAAGELLPQLLSSTIPGDPYWLIAEIAMQAAEADFAAIAVPLGETRMVIRAAAGVLSGEIQDLVLSLDDSIAGDVFTSGKPQLVTSYSSDPSALALGVEIGPLVAVPLVAGEQARGVLTLGRLAGRPALSAADASMAMTFASGAAAALEVLDARHDQLQLARLEDHDRIARDLHDHVIQELFAAGMSIQSLAGVVDNPAHADRIQDHVEALDRVISRIRASIFELRHDRQTPLSLESRLEQVTAEHAPQLGFRPRLHVSGVGGAVIDPKLADDVIAVVREGLSNVARHAAAHTVTVRVAVVGKVLSVEVTDDGRGIPADRSRSSGLTNLRTRATENGGSLLAGDGPSGGTQLVWTAHLSA